MSMLISKWKRPPCKKMYVNGCQMRGGMWWVTASGISANHLRSQIVTEGGASRLTRVCKRKTAEQTSTRSFTPGVMKLRQSKLYRRPPNEVPIFAVYGRKVNPSKERCFAQFSFLRAK